MELIRTKRALTTAGTGVAGGGLVGANGQPKSKYRKRSRATPPGKCHSCNIRETPEWRRGPDGARTLCNACGLHYAKLMRKREKEGGTSQIDMDTLRASARADQAEKSSARANKQAAAANKASFNSGSSNGAAASDSAQPPPPPPPLSHHEGSFQLTLAPSLSPSEVQAQMGARAHVPPPPPPTAWAPQRAYAPEQLQHQSFLRTPQVVGGQASPR
ncbi:GATA-4/5/6 transcription factor [Mycena metata]|uniref:GATA-4/5/6 transcription factor n=1 Tax=Mycena metata TaxID=1033252 RepID=A0AAD7JWX4_9AGAR|nr:GATA-4/5/6 transcription factor [Mycena metata]